MFFAFCPFGTYGTSHSNRPIQLWEAKITIYGNLMLKDARNIYRLKSSIPEVYSKLTGNNIHNTLSIKMSSTNRKLVISCYKENRITNWITSVEDKHKMELYLFLGLSENSKLINYLGELDTSADYDSLNSFH
ncbi:MAG: hypothetical protein EOO43_12950 [Flavobacterium sp.]|nr:MAG: hypothetical protein EOO43_12950 [Flavobacterium sp.]